MAISGTDFLQVPTIYKAENPTDKKGVPEIFQVIQHF